MKPWDGVESRARELGALYRSEIGKFVPSNWPVTLRTGITAAELNPSITDISQRKPVAVICGASGDF